ncbi:MAG: hypothetical protein ACOZAN_02340 [Patescibacteria group bacterium]
MRNIHGYKLHCIDERLDNNRAYLLAEVHGECGACAALQKSLSSFLGGDIWQVEDKLADEIVAKGCTIKQPIFKDMHHLHTSVVIWLSFGSVQVVADDEQRNQLRQTSSLPFRVSLPLFLIKAFLENQLGNGQRSFDLDGLLRVLVKWNVQIARNIIGGDHNSLNEFADKTVFVFDQRNVASEDHLLVDKVEQLVAAVEPNEVAKSKLMIW